MSKRDWKRITCAHKNNLWDKYFLAVWCVELLSAQVIYARTSNYLEARDARADVITISTRVSTISYDCIVHILTQMLPN